MMSGTQKFNLLIQYTEPQRSILTIKAPMLSQDLVVTAGFADRTCYPSMFSFQTITEKLGFLYIINLVLGKGQVLRA